METQCVCREVQAELLSITQMKFSFVTFVHLAKHRTHVLAGYVVDVAYVVITAASFCVAVPCVTA